MAITRQGTGSGLQRSNGSATFAITYSPTTTGRFLTFTGSFVDGAGTPNVVSVVDNNATAWTVKKTAASAGNVMAFVAYLENCGAGITSVTVTMSSTSCFAVGAVDEWVNVATSSAFDQINSAVGNNPLATGNITNGATGELIIACGGSDGSANTAWAANGGYTTIYQEPDATSFHVGKGVFQVGSGTGPFGTTFDWSAANTNVNASLIVSFKEASAGSSDPGYSADFGDAYEMFTGGNEPDVALELTTYESAPVIPDLLVTVPLVQGDESADWWNFYDEPTITDIEWSGPIQPNAPPSDLAVSVDPEFDDALEEFFADDFGNDDADDVVIQDEWSWNEAGDEELAPDPYLLVDVVVASTQVEDAWDWWREDADIDEWQTIVDDGDDAIQSNQIQYFGEDAELVCDEADDAYFLDDYAMVDVVIAASQLFEDPFDHWTFEHGEEIDNALGTDPVGADLLVTTPAIEDAWLHFDDSFEDAREFAFEEPLAADLLDRLAEDLWPHFEEIGDEQWPDDLQLGDIDALAIEDTFPHFDEIAEEVTVDDVAVFDVVLSAQPFDDAWSFDEFTDDDIGADGIVGANFVVPPSQFTDDGWDWTTSWEVEDQVDEPILRADVFALIGDPRFTVRRFRPRFFTVAQVIGRDFTVSAVSNLRFPIKHPSEDIPLKFDFTPDLEDNETLTGVESLTFEVERGTDGNPTAIANGAAGFDVTSKIAIVPVDVGIANVDYRITITCTTSNPLKTLTLVGILPVRT